MTFKDILKEALKKSGMRQVDLANKMEVSRPTISTNMRRDKIGLEVFVKLLSAMGYTVAVGKKIEDMFVPEWYVE